MKHSFLIALFVACSLRAYAAEPDIPALCEKVKSAYVFIGGGSGVVISPDGLMLTNAHVIEKEKQFDIRIGTGKHYRAKLLGQDVDGDLALLKVELKPGETMSHLELGDSDKLQLGDTALAVGNPFAEGLVDQHPTFTLGVVSAVHSYHGNYPDAIITDAPVNPGNSGGPLISLDGKVVGINGQISTRWGLRSNTGLGFAISSHQIGIWLPRLKEANGGVVQHGRIMGLDFESESVSETPKIKQVRANSHADRAGFKAGDRITKFDSQPVSSLIRLASLIGIFPENHEVEVTVDRSGQAVPLKVKLIRPQKGSLGIKFGKPEKKQEYLRIAEVTKGSAGDKAGLLVGDEVTAIDETELKFAVELQFQVLERWQKAAVFKEQPVTIQVRRKGADGKFTTHEIDVVPE